MLAFQMRDVQILACLVVLKVISTKFDAETSLFTFSEVCVRVMHVTAARVFASRVMGSLLGVFLSSLCKPLIVEVGARRRAGEVKKILEKKQKVVSKIRTFFIRFPEKWPRQQAAAAFMHVYFRLVTHENSTHTYRSGAIFFTPCSDLKLETD